MRNVVRPSAPDVPSLTRYLAVDVIKLVEASITDTASLLKFVA
jgi:hypothetical protein